MSVINESTAQHFWTLTDVDHRFLIVKSPVDKVQLIETAYTSTAATFQHISPTEHMYYLTWVYWILLILTAQLMLFSNVYVQGVNTVTTRSLHPQTRRANWLDGLKLLINIRKLLLPLFEITCWTQLNYLGALDYCAFKQFNPPLAHEHIIYNKICFKTLKDLSRHPCLQAVDIRQIKQLALYNPREPESIKGVNRAIIRCNLLAITQNYTQLYKTKPLRFHTKAIKNISTAQVYPVMHLRNSDWIRYKIQLRVDTRRAMDILYRTVCRPANLLEANYLRNIQTQGSLKIKNLSIVKHGWNSYTYNVSMKVKNAVLNISTGDINSHKLHPLRYILLSTERVNRKLKYYPKSQKPVTTDNLLQSLKTDSGIEKKTKTGLSILQLNSTNIWQLINDVDPWQRLSTLKERNKSVGAALNTESKIKQLNQNRIGLNVKLTTYNTPEEEFRFRIFKDAVLGNIATELADVLFPGLTSLNWEAEDKEVVLKKCEACRLENKLRNTYYRQKAAKLGWGGKYAKPWFTVGHFSEYIGTGRKIALRKTPMRYEYLINPPEEMMYVPQFGARQLRRYASWKSKKYQRSNAHGWLYSLRKPKLARATKNHNKIVQLAANRNQYTQRYPRHLPNLRFPNLYQKPRTVPDARKHHSIMLPQFERVHKRLMQRKSSENLSNTTVYKYYHDLYYQRDFDKRRKIRNHTYLHDIQENPRYLHRSERFATGTFDTQDEPGSYATDAFRRGKRTFWLGWYKLPPIGAFALKNLTNCEVRKWLVKSNLLKPEIFETIPFDAWESLFKHNNNYFLPTKFLDNKHLTHLQVAVRLQTDLEYKKLFLEKYTRKPTSKNIYHADTPSSDSNNWKNPIQFLAQTRNKVKTFEWVILPETTASGLSNAPQATPIFHFLKTWDLERRLLKYLNVNYQVLKIHAQASNRVLFYFDVRHKNYYNMDQTITRFYAPKQKSFFPAGRNVPICLYIPWHNFKYMLPDTTKLRGANYLPMRKENFYRHTTNSILKLLDFYPKHIKLTSSVGRALQTKHTQNEQILQPLKKPAALRDISLIRFNRNRRYHNFIRRRRTILGRVTKDYSHWHFEPLMKLYLVAKHKQAFKDLSTSVTPPPLQFLRANKQFLGKAFLKTSNTFDLKKLWKKNKDNRPVVGPRTHHKDRYMRHTQYRLKRDFKKTTFESTSLKWWKARHYTNFLKAYLIDLSHTSKDPLVPRLTLLSQYEEPPKLHLKLFSLKFQNQKTTPKSSGSIIQQFQNLSNLPGTRLERVLFKGLEQVNWLGCFQTDSLIFTQNNTFYFIKNELNQIFAWAPPQVKQAWEVGKIILVDWVWEHNQFFNRYLPNCGLDDIKQEDRLGLKRHSVRNKKLQYKAALIRSKWIFQRYVRLFWWHLKNGTQLALNDRDLNVLYSYIKPMVLNQLKFWLEYTIYLLRFTRSKLQTLFNAKEWVIAFLWPDKKKQISWDVGHYVVNTSNLIETATEYTRLECLPYWLLSLDWNNVFKAFLKWAAEPIRIVECSKLFVQLKQMLNSRLLTPTYLFIDSRRLATTKIEIPFDRWPNVQNPLIDQVLDMTIFIPTSATLHYYAVFEKLDNMLLHQYPLLSSLERARLNYWQCYYRQSSRYKYQTSRILLNMSKDNLQKTKIFNDTSAYGLINVRTGASKKITFIFKPIRHRVWSNKFHQINNHLVINGTNFVEASAYRGERKL